MLVGVDSLRESVESASDHLAVAVVGEGFAGLLTEALMPSCSRQITEFPVILTEVQVQGRIERGHRRGAFLRRQGIRRL